MTETGTPPRELNAYLARRVCTTVVSAAVGAIGVAAHDADEDFGVTEIARHLDAGDGHEAGDPWILCFLREEGRNDLANGCRYAVATTVLGCHA